jgi:hypothetical protein
VLAEEVAAGIKTYIDFIAKLANCI